jgi:hypothetical protein
LWDEDDGIAEALRRDAEIDVNPEQAISLAQLDSYLRKYDDGFVVICSRGSLFNLLPVGTRARSRFHLCANAL